ncbi:MAG: sterol desaturase family protein [Myxococcota bacterium]
MLKTVVAWTFYPGMLLVGLRVTALGIQEGLSPALVVASTIFVSALVIAVVQRWMPFEDEWQAKPQTYWLDMLHMASTGVTTEGYRAATVGLFTAGAVYLQGALGGSLWPNEQPMVLQLALALLIGDLGAYWVHRTCHTSPLFWRVHAMHHSSEQLYAFASARNHPMNAILAYGSQLLPLTLLGANLEVIALLSVFTGINGLLQHANIDLKHGIFNWVFATADLHRWHHSKDFDESNTNFGSNIIVWDIVFGTRALPEGHPEAVGISGLHMPENFLHHLASPFVLNRYTAEALPVHEDGKLRLEG